jgi:D-arabinonate dehydratase
LPHFTIRERDYSIVLIETEDGLQGVGYTLARGGDISGAVERHFKKILIGEDPLYTERLWERMYQAIFLLGQQGFLLRTLSAIDIALWDLKAQIAGLPLYELIGGYRDKVPIIVAGGYVAVGKGLDGLEAELQHYVGQGYQAVKVMVGASPVEEDLKRLRLARKILGPNIKLAVDVQWGWPSLKTGLKIARQMEEFDLDFIEDPFRPDNIERMSAFTAALETPVAMGELEGGRYFRDLILNKAADILRCDATVIGGISEWLKVAAMAAVWGLPILPHFFPEIHVHLVAATANSLAVEYMDPEFDTMQFKQLALEPLNVEDGFMFAPQTPGLALQLDRKALEKYRVN